LSRDYKKKDFVKFLKIKIGVGIREKRRAYIRRGSGGKKAKKFKLE